MNLRERPERARCLYLCAVGVYNLSLFMLSNQQLVRAVHNSSRGRIRATEIGVGGDANPALRQWQRDEGIAEADFYARRHHEEIKRRINSSWLASVTGLRTTNHKMMSWDLAGGNEKAQRGVLRTNIMQNGAN